LRHSLSSGKAPICSSPRRGGYRRGEQSAKHPFSKEIAKSTKFRNSREPISNSFVAFVCFVVQRY
jgi:hypothetical protein